MNLRQLEVFLAVLDQGGFSSASRVTKLTQSTISQHISALENEVGVRLLERSRKGVRATEAGKILRAHAKSLVGELRSAESALRRFRGLEQTTLHVGVSSVPGAELVPQVLAQLCQLHPRLDLVLMQGDTRRIVEAIANREAEVGVVGRRMRVRGLTYTEVGDDRIVLVVAPGHAWAKRKSISIEQLPESDFVVREPGSGTGEVVMAALRAAGADTEALRIRAVVDGNEALKSTVKIGMGAAFFSVVTVARDVDRGELAIVPVQGLSIARPFYLVRRSGRRPSPPANAFWSLILETAAGK
ncbi:MAG TPA: selenium metabolism-associated LysR family transcriptional regulator [bacterium]|nr:selenium metabolism-associated LysR family transcriptional regulator [bacterium]